MSAPQPAPPVPGVSPSLAEILKTWSTYMAAGSFVLYLFGYLALRFHITALGINTDLGVLDEQYLFAGAHFLVYLASSLPWLTLCALPLVAITLNIRKLLPKGARGWIGAVGHSPLWLLWSSLVLALAFIQLLMNRCFELSDLAFAGIPEDLGFLRDVLLNSDDRVRMAFFIGLVFAAILVCAPVIAASRLPLPTRGLRFLFSAALALAAATALLVPVNFGTLILAYPADRTNAIGKTPVTADQRAWLIWRGKDWFTYLVRSSHGNSIVEVAVKGVESIEVQKTESLFSALSERVEPDASVPSANAPQPDVTGTESTAKSTPPAALEKKAAGKPPAKADTGSQQPQQSLVEKLARILGVDRSPRNLKSPGATLPGELWISPAGQSNPTRLGSATDLRSPVFQPGGKFVYALRGDALVRVARSDGGVTQLGRWPGIVKLVGFNVDRPTLILSIVAAGDGMFDIILLPVDSGKPEVLAEKQSADDRMVKSLRAWERRYDRVLVTPEGNDITVEGFLPDPTNVSKCKQDLCSQPSFSPESKEVVFVRSHQN